MKLLARTNRYYIFYSVITYVIMALGLYFAIDYVMRRDVEERLNVERKDFETYVKNHGNWSPSMTFVEDKIALEKISKPHSLDTYFKDTILINRYSGQPAPFREINFYTKIQNDYYKVGIRKSLIESNELLSAITIAMLVILSLGLLLLYIFQSKISRTIWQPFYNTLSQAKNFEIRKEHSLQLNGEGIHEFEELNDVLIKMTDKIRRDYKNLKEFTENASHEIQTPLALISARVEQLIQKNTSEEQMFWIQEIYKATIRLSKINHALLLLAKIENEQFIETKKVDFGSLFENKLEEFEDILNHKSIRINYVKSNPFKTEINPDLADILVSNLLSNAIKHNIIPGKIKIEISKRSLTIANTGKPLKNDFNQLFNRFKKERMNSDSMGLGLAIVKKICDHYHLNIEYQFKDEFHKIHIYPK